MTAIIITRSQAFRRRPRSVYLLKIALIYKIGLSFDPASRVRAMQLPDRPDWVRVYESVRAEELEKVLHQRYKAKRKYGEWFELSEEEVEDLDRFCKEWLSQEK